MARTPKPTPSPEAMDASNFIALARQALPHLQDPEFATWLRRVAGTFEKPAN